MRFLLGMLCGALVAAIVFAVLPAPGPGSDPVPTPAETENPASSETAATPDREPEPEPAATQQAEAEPAPLTPEDAIFICRAAISELMGRPIDIIEGQITGDEEIITTYRRPSDGTRWVNACKLSEDRVIWASVENGQRGRWRDDPADGQVSFALSGDQVEIMQKFGDGSSLRGTFQR